MASFFLGKIVISFLAALRSPGVIPIALNVTASGGIRLLLVLLLLWLSWLGVLCRVSQ